MTEPLENLFLVQSQDREIDETILDAIEFNEGEPFSADVLIRVLIGSSVPQAEHRANRNFGTLRAFSSSKVRNRIEHLISIEVVDETETGLFFEMYPDQSETFDELMNSAKTARDAGQVCQALKLVTKALAMNPQHQGAAAVASSIYRKMERPKDAMRLVDKFRKNGAKYIPLLTSRAAALLDMDSLAKARRQVNEIRSLMDGGREQNLERQDLEFLSKVEARLRWAEEQEFKEREGARQPEPFPDRFY